MDLHPRRPPQFAAARSAFWTFMQRIDSRRSATILCHSDADGLSSGTILYQTLRRLGFCNLTITVTAKGANAYTPQTRQRVANPAPASLFVLDLGCLAQPVVPGVPTCFVDHHRPVGVPPEGTLISSYNWDPIPNSSLLTYWLCSELATINDLTWIAAIGTLSDLGDKAPFDIIAEAKQAYQAKWLHEASALLNAGRRSATGDAETALGALLLASHPRDIANGASPEARRLAEYRREFNDALSQAKRSAPSFRGQTALLRVTSPCQVHPVIAQIWRTRLPKHVVLVGNEGYLPGLVAFSMRTATAINLLDLLAGIELDVAEGYFGQGHDQATGGLLPRKSWNQLLQRFGFPPRLWAAEDHSP